nr:class I SAM-dependent methyltransferase [Candidatus Njordarchaeum guaymaensis]
MGAKGSGEGVTLQDQMRKFVIKGLLGFQSVIVFAIGRRLGIFDYLAQKSKITAGAKMSSSVSFSLEEIANNLHLDAGHVDGWIHMGLVCGLFELDQGAKKTVKTAPFVYELLVDRVSPFYAGDALSTFYYIAPFQEELVKGFRTGKLAKWSDVPEDWLKDEQEGSAFQGRRVEELFSRRFKNLSRRLREGGAILEVGCGFGLHLTHWAKKYERSRVVGLDPDPRAIISTRNVATKDQWNNRAEILNMTTSEYVKTNPSKFDIILLNEVLHEMNPDEDYRRSVFVDMYSLLKDDGILIVADSMVPDTFAPNQERLILEVSHKWFEVAFGSRFYDETSFKSFVESTPFKSAELVREGNLYFWAIKK